MEDQKEKPYVDHRDEIKTDAKPVCVQKKSFKVELKKG